jgi:hypothetical protein
MSNRFEYDLSDETCYDCGSILVDEIMDLGYDDRSTEFLDLQIFKVVEALYYGLDKAIESKAFTDLSIKDIMYFIAEQHGRWPPLAYT